MHAHRWGNPFNLSLCAATRADSCKERKDTPGIAFSGGASPGNEITGLPLKLARPANNRAYYVAFVSTTLLSPCAAEGPSRVTRFPFGLRKRGWRDEGPRGDPRCLGRQQCGVLAQRKTGTIATCRDAWHRSGSSVEEVDRECSVN